MAYRNKDEYRAFQHAWYIRNKTRLLNRVRSHRLRLAEWYFNLKSTYKCETCPENHPACLDFHHKDSNTKLKTVSQLVLRRVSKKRILEEISKCVCWCSNCHRKHHWNETAASAASKAFTRRPVRRRIQTVQRRRVLTV